MGIATNDVTSDTGSNPNVCVYVYIASQGCRCIWHTDEWQTIACCEASGEPPGLASADVHEARGQ